MSALSLQQQMTTQTLIITKSDVKTDKAALQAHGRSKLSVMADPQADDADISRGDDDGADEQGLVITKTQRKLAGPLRGAKKTTTSVLTIQSMWLGKRLQSYECAHLVSPTLASKPAISFPMTHPYSPRFAQAISVLHGTFYTQNRLPSMM